MTTETANSFKGYDFEKPVLDLEQKIQELEKVLQSDGSANGVPDELKELQARCETTKRHIYGKLQPWQRVQLARHPRRPYTQDYINRIFTDFTELHGDRHFSEDKAIVTGLASLGGVSVVVMGHQKGRTVQESMARNFGMPHPEGYRKALRLFEMARRYGMPLFTFIDTAGAYPGIGAEERGQATAIAENLREMADLPVPIICTVIGEGGSGGALAIGVGDRLLMMENAWYSVISPEGCASILYRDASKAPEAAKALKITAVDLKELGIVDEMVPEPLGGAHRAPDVAATALKAAFQTHLEQLMSLSVDKLLEARYRKYRDVGHFEEGQKKQISKTVSRRKKIKT